jgi:hypothetical protein
MIEARAPIVRNPGIFFIVGVGASTSMLMMFLNKNTFSGRWASMLIKDSKILQQKWRDLAAQAVAFKAELGKHGLLKTMHKMEEVVTEIGYEMAEKITGEDQPRPHSKSKKDWHENE